MSAARRYLSRPRTKLYDYNYTMGERLYRPMVDSLDKPRASRTSSSTEPSYQPPSSNSFSKRRSVERDTEDDDTIKKIRAARAKMEEEVRTFEEGSNARRAALRSNSNRVEVSDRLLDSVGVGRRTNDYGDYEYSTSSTGRSRRAVSELEEDPFFTKRTFKTKFEDEDDEPLPRLKSKVRSSLAKESSGDNFDTNAALERAKKSRARLAEIDDEMDLLDQRSKARGARMASAKAVLREAAEVDSSVSSSQQTVRVSKRSVQVSERVG